MAKTGLLSNLNLSQLIKSQNILEEDGIEDLHFYFVSFNNHKGRVLAMQEKKLKKILEQKKGQKPKTQQNNKTIEPLDPDEYLDWND